jgi:hypothetical protein
MLCTFNPSDTGSAITLSNADLTATSGSGDGQSRGTVGYVGGSGSTAAINKLYWEMLFTTTAGQSGMGVSNTGEPNTDYLGETSHGCGYYSNGNVAIQDLAEATLASFSNGALVGMAIDFNLQKAWWTLNGSTWNNDIITNQNPATGVGGFDIGSFGAGGGVFGETDNWYSVFPSFGSATSGNVSTANFGGSAFGYTPPSGFSAWAATFNPTLGMFSLIQR